MRLPSTREASAEEWRSAFAATPGATFVQSPEWAAAAAPVTKGYRAVAHVLDLPGGEAIVPVWEKPAPAPAGGLLSRLRGALSPPARAEGRLDVLGNARGLYAGWLRRTPLDAAERAAVRDWLVARSRVLAWRANPFQAVPEDEWAAWGPVEPDTTYLVDLRRTEEEIYLAYAGGQRTDVNKAKRAGITCRPAAGPADWEAYVALYEETLARWGSRATNRYPREFLLSLADLPADGCRLWVAELDGAVAAAALHFYHRPPGSGGHVLGWHMANRLGIKGLSPTKLLIHEVVLDARRQGYEVYDLNVSGGHEGPERWKQLMGAAPRAAPLVRREPAEVRAERLAREAARDQAAAQAASGGGA